MGMVEIRILSLRVRERGRKLKRNEERKTERKKERKRDPNAGKALVDRKQS